MDDWQKSYEIALSAHMASGRYTSITNADLVAEDDTAIPHFCTLYTHFLSLTHNADSWIYSTISSLALCCAEQSILQQTGPLYRVLHQLPMWGQTGR